MPVSTEQKPLLGKFFLKSHLMLETGLLIGGGTETLNIGGLDKEVVRNPLTREPYIPGSSIKGKLRSIMERSQNKPLNRHGGGGIYRYESDDLEDGYSEVSTQLIPFVGAKICTLSRVFGSTGKVCWVPQEIAVEQGIPLKSEETRIIHGVEHVKVIGRNFPARLIVRDCHLQTASAEQLKRIDTGLYMTEWKSENGIDRVTSAAHPRQIERVPAGAVFEFELVYTVENKDQAVEDIQNLASVLDFLQDDALGGSGSRGYGKVRFQGFQLIYKDVNQYRRRVSGEPEANKEPESIDSTKKLLSNLSQIQELLSS